MLNQAYIVRRMTDQDLDAIMKIENEVFSMPWSRKSYESELRNQWAHYLLCDYEGDVAAYCGMWVVFDEAHITNIAVGKAFQKMGLGRALLMEMEKIARQKKAQFIGLEVRPSNQAALALYGSMGFVETGRRKGYYQDNQEDALLMTKFLY